GSINVSSQSGATVSGNAEPERVQAILVSPDFFDTLGVRPEPGLGRGFLPEEEQPGREKVVVLSHRLWQRRFGADRRLVGGTVVLDGQSYAAAGVMPREFDCPRGAELWLRMPMTPQRRNARSSHDVWTVARLDPGVSVAQARSELAGIARRLEAEHPDSNRGWGVALEPLLH